GVALPLEQDRQVGRLLALDDEVALADGVRQPGGQVDGVTLAHGDLVHRTEDRVDVLAVDPRPQLLARHVARERDVRLGVGERDPALGLAVADAQVRLRERHVRVDVHRQALARVEQLDEDDVGPVPVHVRLAEPRGRVRLDLVAEQAAVGQPRQPDVGRAEDGRRRPDPVLRRVQDGVVGPRFETPEGSDPLTAGVEAVRRLVGTQVDGLHGHLLVRGRIVGSPASRRRAYRSRKPPANVSPRPMVVGSSTSTRGVATARTRGRAASAALATARPSGSGGSARVASTSDGASRSPTRYRVEASSTPPARQSTSVSWSSPATSAQARVWTTRFLAGTRSASAATAAVTSAGSSRSSVRPMTAFISSSFIDPTYTPARTCCWTTGWR